MPKRRSTSGKVVALAMSVDAARRIVHKLAAESGRVYVTPHAANRLKERGITRPQVIECLRKGRIIEGPALGTRGHWEMKFERQWCGEIVKVVAALHWDPDLRDNVVVITVMGDVR
ncbi:MAG: DUF4258 domain-containing protein [Steroidobacteraceae bacterium]|nr:DUF4258 domain-containing protein [Steroidobacteraceae bacterium]